MSDVSSDVSSDVDDYVNNINWNDVARDTVSDALKTIPKYGTVIGTLVYTFWPSGGDNVWSQIKDQVETLMDEKIAENVYQTVQDDLTGLQTALNDYVEATNGTDFEYIRDKWVATETAFQTAMPHFQQSGYELLLLPLYAQFMNLYLSLMRDCALYGATWGFEADTVSNTANELSALIKAATPYAISTYQQGVDSKVKSTKRNDHECEPFRTVNAYIREMTLGVLDFANLWPSFSTTTPTTAYLDREIYSDPVGTCDNSGPIALDPAPTAPPTQIYVWGWDRIDAVQLVYPPSCGPAGHTITARMGDQNGGSDQSPHGGVFDVSNNPVTVARGRAGDILNSFKFTFQDGTTTYMLGGGAGGGDSFAFGYTGEVLSSIHINGVSTSYGSADCAVFGFKFPKT